MLIGMDIISSGFALIFFRTSFPDVLLSDGLIIVGTFLTLFGGIAACINDTREERRRGPEEEKQMLESELTAD